MNKYVIPEGIPRQDTESVSPDRPTVRALAFTEHGMQTGERVRELLPQVQLMRCPKGGLSEWTARSFEIADVIIYIGAMGIAVRAIAPYVVNKLHDPAVLVIDELGHYVIPVLSGHVGGANAAASLIAGALGSTAVITTATDINGKFAVDVWAVKNNLRILNKDGIKAVSSKVLKDEPVYVYTQWEIAGRLPDGLRLTDDPETADVIIACAPRLSGAEDGIRFDRGTSGAEDGIRFDRGTAGAGEGDDGQSVKSSGGPDDICATEDPEGERRYRALYLVPGCLYLGIGCRRGISREAIEEAWEQVREECGIAGEAIAGVTSIDVKAQEPGLLAFCKAHGWSFSTYDEVQLNAVPGEFHGSEFVKKTVGVDSVCERSSLLAARNALLPGGRPGTGIPADAAEGPEDTGDTADTDGTGKAAPGLEGAARILVPKTARNGVTVAVALAEPSLSWM